MNLYRARGFFRAGPRGSAFQVIGVGEEVPVEPRFVTGAAQGAVTRVLPARDTGRLSAEQRPLDVQNCRAAYRLRGQRETPPSPEKAICTGPGVFSAPGREAAHSGPPGLRGRGGEERADGSAVRCRRRRCI